VSIRKAIKTLKRYDGMVEQATELELADAAARADRTGLFNCPHTGVALAALEKLIIRGEVKRTDCVIVISTANGLKFTDFKVAYHSADPARRGRFANPPINLPNDYDRVRQAVDELTLTGAASKR
jgi:threonine synthase